jgi:hypothetical protein
MASPAKLYQQEMHDNLGFFANWLPGDPLELGDAGVLEGGRFRRLASLGELGIEFAPDVSTSQQDVRYTSTSGVRLGAGTGADVAGIARATLNIEFARAGAFVFHASKLAVRSLTDRVAIGQGLLRAYENSRWDKGWLLVDGIHVAERATIIVSQDRSAALTLAARVAGDLLGVSLADPSIEFEVVSTRGTVVHAVGERDLHPLYSCLYVKDSWFGPPALRPVRGARAAEADVPFARPGIRDLLDS